MASGPFFNIPEIPNILVLLYSLKNIQYIPVVPCPMISFSSNNVTIVSSLCKLRVRLLNMKFGASVLLLSNKSSVSFEILYPGAHLYHILSWKLDSFFFQQGCFWNCSTLLTDVFDHELCRDVLNLTMLSSERMFRHFTFLV